MKLDAKTIANITLFENISGASIKDCFEEEEGLLFIVKEGNVKRALGPDNRNLRRIQSLLKKKIRIIAFSKEPEKFINNLLYPIRAEKVEIEGKTLKITASDTRSKGRIFGRSKENLRKIKEMVKKYYDLDEVDVI